MLPGAMTAEFNLYHGYITNGLFKNLIVTKDNIYEAGEYNLFLKYVSANDTINNVEEKQFSHQYEEDTKLLEKINNFNNRYHSS